MELWIGFGVLVAILLGIDLLAHRKQHVRAEPRRRALIWSVVWISAGLLFALVVWAFLGGDAATEYVTAYLLEKSLSVDNMLVFLLIFSALRVPLAEQRRALSWGILGAVVMRGVFIAAGSVVLEKWHPVVYLFGALLLLTALKVLHGALSAETPEPPRMVRWILRRRDAGGAAPLLLVILVVELTDVLFAVDSIPAAFAVTERPFVIYASNVFAILGLRALYVVVADLLGRLVYLRHGLAVILAFVGVKMVISGWVHTPPWVSLAVIAFILAVTVLASLQSRRKRAKFPAGETSEI
jgi:tellurite resistance protein TerC